MKAKIIFWIGLFTIMTSSAQTVDNKNLDEELKTAVYDILELSIQRNIEQLNTKYIHPNYGIYDVFRRGTSDHYTKHDDIFFAFPKKGKEGSMFPNLILLKNDTIPKKLEVYSVSWDCEEMVWDKEGFFITDNIEYPKITQIIATQEEFFGGAPSNSDKKKGEYIEKNSYRVVFTKHDIAFYITKIDGKWYLTLFDRVSTDCSA